MPYSQGTDWLSLKDNTIIKIGDEKILTKKMDCKRKSSRNRLSKIKWKANEITKEMATVSIENKSKVPIWRNLLAIFEDSDKIKPILIPVCLFQRVIPKENTDKGQVLQKITTKNPLNIGDLVTVRLIISTKEVEFVHLKT
jgi:hypothetical protein